jgi:UDP-glucose 4-epimerase
MRIQELLLMIREMMNERVEVSWANGEPTGHYHLTPYSFMPQIGHKLVPEDYIDLGQGLMDTLTELLEQYHGMDEVLIDQGPNADRHGR